MRVQHHQNDIEVFENTYNIVNIKDGKAAVDMKIVGGKRMPLSEIVEKYKPYLET
jgi:3',5'-cyclic-AMP phosphodiesterase